VLSDGGGEIRVNMKKSLGKGSIPRNDNTTVRNSLRKRFRIKTDEIYVIPLDQERWEVLVNLACKMETIVARAY
jgi:hypothetical protein